MLKLYTSSSHPLGDNCPKAGIAECERRLHRLLDRMARTSYRLPSAAQLEALALYESAEQELRDNTRDAHKNIAEANASLDTLEDLLWGTL